MTQLSVAADLLSGRPVGDTDAAGAAEQPHTTRAHATSTIRRII
jgi:hypothetical protein